MNTANTDRSSYHNGIPCLNAAQVEAHLVLCDLFNAGDFAAYVLAAAAFLADVEASSLALAGAWESWEGPRFALAQIARGVARKFQIAEDRIKDRASK